MTKKLSQYEKYERQHKKDTADILKYLRKVIKKTLPYHTTDIGIDDLQLACEEIEQVQVKLATAKEQNKRLRDAIQARRQWQTCPSCNRTFATQS